MNRHRLICLAMGAAWICLAGPAVQGDIVYIEYRDQNPPTSSFPNAGGPHWTGFVDTAANTLTIDTWNEIPGSTQFWTPLWTPDLTVLPLVWLAVDSSGNPYDVPDAFDGTINASFGFVSPVSARNMLWNEGTFLLPEAADFYPGWGAVRRPLEGSNPVELIYDTTADQFTMPMLPTHAFGVAASTFAIVTATSGASTEPIPETSAFLFAAAATLAASCWAARRKIRL